MYELTVFYTGPLYKWAGKIDEKEVLKRKQFKTFFFARVQADALTREMDNVSWIIEREGQLVETA